MKTTITTALAILAATASFCCPVGAQTVANSNANMRSYALTGNSLVGVNNRTSQNDFSKFFPQRDPSRNPIGTVSEDTINYTGFWQVGNQVELRRSITEPLSAITSQPVSATNTVVFPRADQSFNANDGLQAIYTIDGDNALR